MRKRCTKGGSSGRRWRSGGLMGRYRCSVCFVRDCTYRDVLVLTAVRLLESVFLQDAELTLIIQFQTYVASVASCAAMPLSWLVTPLAATRADPGWWCQHAPSLPWQCERPLLLLLAKKWIVPSGNRGKNLLFSQENWEPTFGERQRGRSLCESAVFTRKAQGATNQPAHWETSCLARMKGESSMLKWVYQSEVRPMKEG